MSINFIPNSSRNIYMAIKDTGWSNEIYKIHQVNDLHKRAYYEFMRIINTQKINWDLVDAGRRLPKITSLKSISIHPNHANYISTYLNTCLTTYRIRATTF